MLELSARERKFALLFHLKKIFFFCDPNFYLLIVLPVFSRKALPSRSFQTFAFQVAPNAKKNIQLGI